MSLSRIRERQNSSRSLNIATARCQDDNYPAAQEYIDRTVIGLEERLGSAHLYTLAAKLVLARLLVRNEGPRAGAHVEELVLAERARMLIPLHPDTLRCHVDPLLTQERLGEPGAAT